MLNHGARHLREERLTTPGETSSCQQTHSSMAAVWDGWCSKQISRYRRRQPRASFRVTWFRDGMILQLEEYVASSSEPGREQSPPSLVFAERLYSCSVLSHSSGGNSRPESRGKREGGQRKKGTETKKPKGRNIAARCQSLVVVVIVAHSLYRRSHLASPYWSPNPLSLSSLLVCPSSALLCSPPLFASPLP